jgi:hypothetical protein
MNKCTIVNISGINECIRNNKNDIFFLRCLIEREEREKKRENVYKVKKANFS